MNAIQLLRHMHADTKVRFKVVLAAQDAAERQAQWQALQPLLDLHEQIEDQFVYTPLRGGARRLGCAPRGRRRRREAAHTAQRRAVQASAPELAHGVSPSVNDALFQACHGRRGPDLRSHRAGVASRAPRNGRRRDAEGQGRPAKPSQPARGVDGRGSTWPPTTTPTATSATACRPTAWTKSSSCTRSRRAPRTSS